ncbi:MAG: DapH/DapD/GlmU-related protein, partial [Syntrophales bacterium]|nr:DapH/DapD/GlmU-related protein [Syntrophales bacterium]
VFVRSIHPTLFTTIGDHAIIGIASNIGHEAQIGKNCVVSNNCVIARMARIEEGAWIGTSSFIREYIRIGRSAKVMAGSIVIRDVANGQSVSGNFAVDHRLNAMEYLRRQNK